MTNVRHLWIVAFATAAVALLALWEIHGGFSLWDEGFLWYGSQRVLRGEIPIRDFQAYDPGRYYWSASFMALTGSDGIVVTRLAAYAFQAIGICALLLSVKADRIRATHSAMALLLALMLLWMFPRHKLYDATVCLLLLAGMAFWLRHPGARASLLLGIWVGLAACIGRNHGLYGAVAGMALLLAYSEAGQRMKALMMFAIGVFAGYLPVFLMLLISPAFAKEFIQGIGILFEIKATNLPIPVPWPWAWKAGFSIRDAVVSAHFLLLAAIPAAAIFLCIRRRILGQSTEATMVAAAFLSLPYAHFAFSRADINHLAQGILPTVIFAVLWMFHLRPSRRWSVLAALGMGLIVMLPMHPGWTAWREGWQPTNIAGEQIRLPETGRIEIEALQNVLERNSASGKPFVATPYWPGAYALMRQRSPMWEIYALVPRKPAFERQEIARVQAADPSLILLMDYPIDGMDERRIERTHPLLYAYVLARYTELPADPALAGTRLFTR